METRIVPPVPPVSPQQPNWDGGAPDNRELTWISLLRTARAPLAVVAVAAVALGLPPQIPDMIAGFDDTGEPVWPVVSLHAALFCLALNAWYWSRAAIYARFEVDETQGRTRDELIAVKLRGASAVTIERARRAFDRTPRLLFLAVALLGAIVTGRAGAWGQFVIVAIWAGLGWLIIHFRVRPPPPQTSLSRLLAWPRMPASPGSQPAGLRAERALVGAIRAVPARVRALVRYAPSRNWFAWFWLAFAALMFLAGAVETMTIWPDGFPGIAGLIAAVFRGPAAALICLALAIGPLTALCFIADGFDLRLGAWTLPRPPVFVVLGVVVSVVPVLFTLHTVRIADAKPDLVDPAHRATPRDLFGAWAKGCAAGQTTVRPVIVAASGGATRAGLWAAAVLRAVEKAADGQPGRPRIFAVSSVSGGSLGTAGWFALHARSPLAPAAAGASCAGIGSAGDPDLALAGLYGDSLGPVLAALFVNDVPRALLGAFAAPVRFLTGFEARGGDRAEAIERGFETLWRSARDAAKVTGVPGFEAPFLSLAYAGRNGEQTDVRIGVPIWIANGTDSHGGGRVITVPFRGETRNQETPEEIWPFPDARDALALLNADVRISTAINNTARFPFLEPAGEMTRHQPSTEVTSPRLSDQPTQLIDGGVFENEGLQTALDLARWLTKYGPAAVPGVSAVEPIIVEVTSDAERTVTQGQVVRCGSGPDDPAASVGGGRPLQALAPLLGLNATRSGHSAVLLRETRQDFCGNGPATQRFFHFYLPAPPGFDVPLNWVLSKRVANYIWSIAMRDAGNADEYKRLTDRFAQ